MRCFIGIQLPTKLRGKVAAFSRECGYLSTEPHIPLISSSLLQNTTVVQQKLESFCLSQMDFQVTVAGPQLRGNQVLYLTVMPGQINMMRNQLAKQLRVDLTGQIYRPHVALVRQGTGEQASLASLLNRAQEIFADHQTFDVTQATLYSRSDPSQPFQPTLTVPFTGR